MIRIAVLGDIGSGKSYVAKLFNYPVFNADSEVSKLYKKSRKCFKKLKKALPEHIISFPIKKNEVSEAIIFKQHNLRKIVKIIHPIIRFKMNKFIKKNKNKKIIVLDIPLLLENKLNKKNYILIFVRARKSKIMKNLKKRKNYNPKILKVLKKFQLPLELKRKKSNYIINNNFRKLYVKKNIKIIKNKILNK